MKRHQEFVELKYSCKIIEIESSTLSFFCRSFCANHMLVQKSGTLPTKKVVWETKSREKAFFTGKNDFLRFVVPKCSLCQCPVESSSNNIFS